MAIQKKKFVEIYIPLLRENYTSLGTPESLNGKTIKLDLTRRLRGKGLEIIFHIKEQGKELVAIPKSLILTGSYIRRIMRPSISYVEDSFQVETKDNIIVSAKPFFITRKKVSRAVRAHLRSEAKKIITDLIKEKSYLDLTEEIYMGIFQKTLLPKMKKIYPLAFCDLRIFETKEINKIKVEISKKPEEKKVTEEIDQVKELEEEEKSEKNKEE